VSTIAAKIEQLGEYINALKGPLLLADWIISVTDGDGNLCDGDIAGTRSLINRDEAIIAIGEAFWRKTADEQRLTIAHELVHIIQSPYWMLLADGILKSGIVTNDTWSIFFTPLNALMERSVEKIARIIYRQLPPLPWECSEE
jgi:hypothetical protein